jgi:hypothetical protein
MLARSRRWTRACVLHTEGGPHALVVRSPPSGIALPGETRRSISLREIAWRGVLGRRGAGGWSGGYFVLLRPGVARLELSGDGSLAPPEGMLMQLKSEPVVVNEGEEGKEQGALCEANWSIGADAQVGQSWHPSANMHLAC